MPIKLLIVDNDKINLPLMKEIFTIHKYKVFTAFSGEKGLSIIEKKKVDIVLTDIMMPKMDGRVLIRKAKEFSPGLVAYAFSAFCRPDVISQAIKCGAHDFIEKPFDIPALIKIIGCEAKIIRRQKEQDRQAQKPLYFMGVSGQAQNVRRQKIIAAKNDFSILITGETGTGKELVAKGICKRSARKDKPFVVVNCAGIPESLVESELFGFEKGAFTGANRRFKGKFESAHNGTLFLDEIGDMPIMLQTRLLRFLQEKEIQPLGKEGTIHADVRIIAATNAHLPDLIAKGRFREDLYHRLNVFPIHISPLRERPEDVRELACCFFKEINSRSKKKKRLTETFISSLMRCSFTGNVRELKNIIQRSYALSEGYSIKLPRGMGAPDELHESKPDEKTRPLDDVAKDYCKRALTREGNNIKQTAEKLGISRNTLKKLLKE